MAGEDWGGDRVGGLRSRGGEETEIRRETGSSRAKAETVRLSAQHTWSHGDAFACVLQALMMTGRWSAHIAATLQSEGHIICGPIMILTCLSVLKTHSQKAAIFNVVSHAVTCTPCCRHGYIGTN